MRKPLSVIFHLFHEYYQVHGLGWSRSSPMLSLWFIWEAMSEFRSVGLLWKFAFSSAKRQLLAYAWTQWMAPQDLPRTLNCGAVAKGGVGLPPTKSQLLWRLMSLCRLDGLKHYFLSLPLLWEWPGNSQLKRSFKRQVAPTVPRRIRHCLSWTFE